MRQQNKLRHTTNGKACKTQCTINTYTIGNDLGCQDFRILLASFQFFFSEMVVGEFRNWLTPLTFTCFKAILWFLLADKRVMSIMTGVKSNKLPQVYAFFTRTYPSRNQFKLSTLQKHAKPQYMLNSLQNISSFQMQN